MHRSHFFNQRMVTQRIKDDLLESVGSLISVRPSRTSVLAFQSENGMGSLLELINAAGGDVGSEVALVQFFVDDGALLPWVCDPFKSCSPCNAVQRAAAERDFRPHG